MPGSATKERLSQKYEVYEVFKWSILAWMIFIAPTCSNSAFAFITTRTPPEDEVESVQFSGNIYQKKDLHMTRKPAWNLSIPAESDLSREEKKDARCQKPNRNT